MSSIKLQKKVYIQVDEKYPPVIACSNGTIFMYSTANGLLKIFLSGSENNVELQKSPFIESRVTCMSVSPAHTFGVACYEDGSILIYNIIHNKIAKSLSKELSRKITHITFISDTDFLIFDSDLNLTLFSLVSMSIFGYTVKSSKVKTFKLFPFKLVAPPVHKSVTEIPEHLSTKSYCIAPKFNYVAGICLFKQLIIAKFKPSYQVIFETSEDDLLIEKPFLTFTLHDPDTLLAAYSTTKEIIILSITMDAKGNYSTDCIFRKKYYFKIQFMSFFSTSFIAVVIENNELILYNFKKPDEDFQMEMLKTDGIFFGDFGKIDIFTPKSIVSFFLSTFASSVEALKEEGNLKEIIELSKKAAKGDPGSIVGLSSDENVRCLEIEKLTNDILKQYFQSQRGFMMKDMADQIVELMIELKNKGFIANEALQLFIGWGGTKEFFSSVLNHDPKGDKFTYSQAFVRDIIDKYETDEYCQNDEEKQQYFEQIKSFLLSLPPKIAKPKWLIDFSLKRNDYMMTIDVCANRMYDPIMALNLLESLKQFELVPEIFLNHVFKGNIEIIEWIVTPDSETNKFLRLQTSIQSSTEKMIEALKWMNETMANVQIESRKAAKESAAAIQSQTQETTKNKNVTSESSKPLALLKDLYIYLKESNGKEAKKEEEEESLENNRDSQLNDSSINIGQVKEVVRTNVAKSILTNDYYVHALITSLIDMKIGYQTVLFKVVQDHVINNCPDSFSNPTLKYLIESVFSKEFSEPDLRETLLSSLIFNGHVISNQLALSLLSLCELYDYNEAASFIRTQLHLLGEMLKSIIIENNFDEALAFINANYRDDLQSMEDIENVVIYYAPYFIEYNCEKFVEVLNNVRFRILYNDLPKSISIVNTRLLFMRALYIKFDPPKIKKSEESENGPIFFLKSLTKFWRDRKSKKKESADPLAEIYAAYTNKDMDTVYALGEEYFGNRSKFILPIILKNMSPDKLEDMEKIASSKGDNENTDNNDGNDFIGIASKLINGALLYNIQRVIENEKAKREEKANQQASAESEKEEKERKKKIEQKQVEDFFAKGRIELEKQIKVIIPFLTHYYPKDVITVMRKFPEGFIEKEADKSDTNNTKDDEASNKSITQMCEEAGLYDCCAYCEALNQNFDLAVKYLRTVIIIDPIQNEQAIIETCQLIFDSQKARSQGTEDIKKQKDQVGGWEDDKNDKSDNDEDDDEEEDESKEKDENNSNDKNNINLIGHAVFILKSFALQFSKAIDDNEKFDLIAHVYRHVCDLIEISEAASFEQLLCITKKTYGKMQKGKDEKFQRLSRSLIVGRIFSGDLSFETREFVKSAVAKSLSTDSQENVVIDNTNEELNNILNGLMCCNCKVRLLVGKEPIAILSCGHAVHYKPYCCSAAADGIPAPTDGKIQKNMCNLNVKCPICSKEQKEEERSSNDNNNNDDDDEEEKQEAEKK